MPMSDRVLRAINKGRRKAGLKPIRRKGTKPTGEKMYGNLTETQRAKIFKRAKAQTTRTRKKYGKLPILNNAREEEIFERGFRAGVRKVEKMNEWKKRT